VAITASQHAAPIDGAAKAAAIAEDFRAPHTVQNRPRQPGFLGIPAQSLPPRRREAGIHPHQPDGLPPDQCQDNPARSDEQGAEPCSIQRRPRMDYWLSAAIPALATTSSCAPVPPEQPMAPIILPPSINGTPPREATTPFNDSR